MSFCIFKYYFKICRMQTDKRLLTTVLLFGFMFVFAYVNILVSVFVFILYNEGGFALSTIVHVIKRELGVFCHLSLKNIHLNLTYNGFLLYIWVWASEKIQTHCKIRFISFSPKTFLFHQTKVSET